MYFNDCPGCAHMSNVIQNNPDELLRRSTSQLLAYFMTDKSRYIVTMRDPTERLISQFFYNHKLPKVQVRLKQYLKLILKLKQELSAAYYLMFRRGFIWFKI